MNKDRRSLIPNQEELLPPLADSILPLLEMKPLPKPFSKPIPWPHSKPPFEKEWPPFEPLYIPPFYFNSLLCGCYLIKLSLNIDELSVFDGTLRVECHSNGVTASGDLYQRKIHQVCLKPKQSDSLPTCILTLDFGPDSADGIPIFPRDQYRYYLRVTKIIEREILENSFNLEFEMYRFDSSLKTWTNEGAYRADMFFWITPPVGYPSNSVYLEGNVRNSSGTVIGRLTMGWVCSYLRRAIVEIDRVHDSEAPLDNGAEIDWRYIFDQVGWDITVDESDDTVIEPSGESWSYAECHQTMLQWRDSADLDTQWRYHLLCVRLLDDTRKVPGCMYDYSGGDTNNIPREGAVIASHWVFPDDDLWGQCSGRRAGLATATYFRTAVHEIGHAMMLFHSKSAGNHIMKTTEDIAKNAKFHMGFPDNIEWAFSAEDQRRLRHLPDVVVRPGTLLTYGEIKSSEYSGVPLSLLDAITEIEGLEVQVSPLMEMIPIGAPVRVNFCLVNNSSQIMSVPSRLSMKTGHISGEVIDPSGTVRTFSTIIRYIDKEDARTLEPGQKLCDSLTLLRGPEGALFPLSGVHRVIIRLTWNVNNRPVQLSGETGVIITPLVDEEHAKSAFKVLSTPDTLITVAIGGDHMTEGIEAIQVALNNPILRPHFEYLEAKRLAQRFGKRKSNIKAAAELITKETIMSLSEIKKITKLIKKKENDSDPGKSIANILKNKAKTFDSDDELKDIMDSL